MEDPSIALALALLDVADRTQAAAFEPLDARLNAAAVARARTTGWDRYAYSAIIVPGAGPDDPAVPLSPGGKLRVRLAADAYHRGLAPFILLTGGAVHPRGTHYVEAVEMGRALIERYGVPPDAIVIEPYARHTTTNLRDAVRRLRALGAPMDKEALIVTDAVQSRYIEGATFASRLRTELGYLPGDLGPRRSITELPFHPSVSSLRVDPMDPLDP